MNQPFPPPPAPGPYRPPLPPQPPKKKSGATVLIVTLASCTGLFVLLVVGVALIGTTAPSTTTTTSPAPSEAGALPAGEADPQEAPEETPPETTPPGRSVGDPAPIGTAVSPALDWTVTVQGVEQDATGRAVAANQFNKPAAGNRLLAVTVAIQNTGDRPASPSSNLKIEALLPAGSTVNAEWLITGIDVLDFNDLAQDVQPGGTLNGELFFEVPADAEVVLLAEPTLTLDEVEDQRFLALI